MPRLTVINPDALYDCWYRLDFTICPDSSENDEWSVADAVGLIGYAFREVLAGEEVWYDDEEGSVVENVVTSALAFTVEYDCTKSRRDDPDYMLALERAALYLNEGTPVRKTDRSGPGTAGTRQQQGIGPCTITVTVP